MNPVNQSPATVPIGQAAVQAMAEGINNGLRPQGSTTPDSNSSTKKNIKHGRKEFIGESIVCQCYSKGVD